MRIHSQKIEKMNIVQRVSQLSEVDPKKLQGKPFLRKCAIILNDGLLFPIDVFCLIRHVVNEDKNPQLSKVQDFIGKLAQNIRIPLCMFAYDYRPSRARAKVDV